MAKRQAKSKRHKSKIKSIQLKRRSRKNRYSSRSPFTPGSFSTFLEKTVTVRSLLKYTCITLAFVIVLASVFLLGRISAHAEDMVDAPAKTMQLSGQTKQVIRSIPETKDTDTDGVEDAAPEEEVDDEVIETANLSEFEPATETAEYTSDEEEVAPPSCEKTVAGFDYSYSKVAIDVSNFNKELKGDNWGSISALKLTVTNNEPCTIINPTKIKMKLNAKGKGSVWWDDDVFLPDSFEHMLPGSTVSEIVPVHVSYSDIYAEKDFRLTVFDDYDIPIGTVKKDITLH